MTRWTPYLLAALLGTVVALPMYAAVSSTGEINVQDDPSGRVPTSSTPTFILTLLVDPSQAEPGEEIKTIEIVLPTGFTVTPQNIVDVRIDNQTVGFETIITGTSVRLELTNEIDHFVSSILEVIFQARTPDQPVTEALFRIAIRNPNNAQIGEFIKPGEIDGNPNNNNDYTIDVFPNVPPDTPTGISVVADETGENDAIISWTPLTDPDVQGYFIYRDGNPPFDARGRASSSYRDVNVPAGIHAYTVAAYKSRLVVSPRSEPQSVMIGVDTNAPTPVRVFTLTQVAQGTELRWSASASADVARYDALFSVGGASPQVISSIVAETGVTEYTFLHRERLDVGRYMFAIVAVDEAGNISELIEETLALLDVPFPNPFTPLGSAPFNRVTFPSRAIDGGQGDMTVRVFDLRGRQMIELFAAGGDVTWDGRDDGGTLLPGGIYVYQIEIGGLFRIGTIVLIR
ncbi:MAG: hypothetical protein O3A46_08835 [Candidatus Poribacteria bacterium]|nr:hypothetical protein [Candidatus Poribacteria bacterium]